MSFRRIPVASETFLANAVELVKQVGAKTVVLTRVLGAKIDWCHRGCC
jgi:hypothetical protein